MGGKNYFFFPLAVGKLTQTSRRLFIALTGNSTLPKLLSKQMRKESQRRRTDRQFNTLVSCLEGLSLSLNAVALTGNSTRGRYDEW